MWYIECTMEEAHREHILINVHIVLIALMNKKPFFSRLNATLGWSSLINQKTSIHPTHTSASNVKCNKCIFFYNSNWALFSHHPISLEIVFNCFNGIGKWICHQYYFISTIINVIIIVDKWIATFRRCAFASIADICFTAQNM